MNSRPFVAMPSDDDGVEALASGHFLIGRPLKAIPDSPQSYNHSLFINGNSVSLYYLISGGDDQLSNLPAYKGSTSGKKHISW